MRMIVRSAALTAAVIGMQGCEPKQSEEQSDSETIASEAVDAPDNDHNLLEACVLRMHAPEVREWKTYWDPRADGLVREGPSSAGSLYWANEEERQKLPTTGMGAVPPLSFTCTAEDQDGQSEIVIGLGAYGSTDQHVPFGQGSYPVIGRFESENKPGSFVANVVFGESLFDASGGTLNIERFDSEGVAGSFHVQAKELAGNNRTLQLDGTFDMPCRGGPLEGKCTANKAIRD